MVHRDRGAGKGGVSCEGHPVDRTPGFTALS